MFWMQMLFVAAFAAIPSLSVIAQEQVVYSTNFESGVGREWSSGAIRSSPTDEPILGSFGNQTVSLSLEQLPSHGEVTIEFDLWLLRTWDGNGVPGPDVWEINVGDVRKLLRTTFSTTGSAGNRQAYPDEYPGGDHPAGTGALLHANHAYSQYELRFSSPHVDSGMIINFLAGGLQALDDESWALAKVRVSVSGTPQLPDAPGGFTVQHPEGSGIAILEWHPSLLWVDRYRIERRVGYCSEWLTLPPEIPFSSSTIQVADVPLPEARDICYRVRAINSVGVSLPTSEICIRATPGSFTQMQIYVPGTTPQEKGSWTGFFPCDPHFDPRYGTAVIVHGWDPPIFGGDQLNSWMLQMAHQISSRVPGGVNILAWDWITEASQLEPLVTGIEPQAQRLASSLRVLLPDGYTGPVHFIGHSLGSRIVTTAAINLAQGVTVPNVFPPAQVTQLDTPDWVGSGLLNEEVPALRRVGTYVDSYHGLTNLSTHFANLWVNVPGVSHRVDWYLNTTLIGRDPLLRQEPWCFAEVLFGTVGFGASILVTDLAHPDRNRPLSSMCEATGTLQFSELSLCRRLAGDDSGVFGFDNYQECQEPFVSFPTTTVGLDLGNLECSLGNNCGSITDIGEYLLNLPLGGGRGGGQQVQEGVFARYSIPLVVQSTWDYVSFEYSFTEAEVPATFECSVTTTDAFHPVLQVLSDLTLGQGYLNSGLRDIRRLHGQMVTFQFELQSLLPGSTVYLRNLTFWQDQWNGNQSPIVNAGPDQEVSADIDGFGAVALDGTATTDPDGDAPLQYWWMLEDGLLAAGVQPTVDLPSGQFSITLIVRDPAGNVGMDEVMVVVTGGISFRRGDSNTDGAVDISDSVNTLGYLFTGGGRVDCADAADANDSGDLDISDPIFTLGWLFLGTTDPPAPGPFTPGSDSTLDDLYCLEY
ncbi:MAG: hypothetical protein Q7S23_01295 [bacterium]|nr:hypothetical protein [bacterium]